MALTSDGRVPFGDGPAMHIPQEWVEPMLRILYRDHREAFGAAAGEVTSGVRYRPVRSRRTDDDTADQAGAET